MLLDTQNLFSDNQKITQASTNSQNTVYFGKGDVSYVPLIIQVTEDFSGVTSLEVNIQTSDKEDFTNAASLVETSLSATDLKSGARFPVAYLPKGNKGYMRLVYTATASSESTTIQGSITAGVVAGDENNSL